MKILSYYPKTGDAKRDQMICKILETLDAREQRLITSKRIKYLRENDDDVFFGVHDIKQESYVGSTDSKYWYRCMSRDQFLHLLSKDSMDFTAEKDYGGVACNYSYSADPKYFGAKKSGRYIVEFEFPNTLSDFLSQVGKQRGIANLEKRGKGEGGRAWSLGFATSGNCHEAMNDFNNGLEKNIIGWRLVQCRYPKPSGSKRK